MKKLLLAAALGLCIGSPAFAKLEISDKGRFVRFEDTSSPSPLILYLRKTSVESVQTFMQEQYMRLELVTSEIISDKGASRNRTYTWRISGGRVEAEKQAETLIAILGGAR